MVGLRFGCLVLLCVALSGCTKSSAPLPLSLALAQQPDNALNFIAIDQDYFSDQGINLSYDFFASGKKAFEEGYQKGGYDVVTMAEVPFVFAVDQMPELRIFGHIYGADNVNRLVTRRDVGFDSMDQIAGKVIGTQKSSAVHYFFHRIYNAFEIPRDQFELKFYEAKALPKALLEKQIDGFSMREPYVSEAEKLLKGRVNVFSMPGIYHQYGVLVASEQSIETNRQVLKRYIRALMQAREFAIQHPQAAIKIVAQYLQIEPSDARVLWRSSNLQLGLHQGLVNTLEGQLSWRNQLVKFGVDSKGVDLQQINVSDYVEVSVMQAVNPDAVLMVHAYDQSQ